MSGPKVLRIVTREEILEICRGQIAQVEAALREWDRVGSRNQVIADTDRAKMRSKLQRIKRLLEQDKFVEVQKDSPLLVESIRRDMSLRVEELHLKQTSARRREESLRLSAKQLYDQLRKAAVAIPVVLQDRLLAMSENRNVPAEDLQQVVIDAMRLLPESASKLTSEKQVALIQQLGGSDKARKLDEWLESFQPQKASTAMKTLDRYLAQLAACDEIDELSRLTERVELARTEANETRQKMLLDSLCLEAAGAARRGQEHMQVKQAVEDARANVIASGDMDVCRAAMETLDSSLAARDFNLAKMGLVQLKKVHDAAVQRRAAQSSRLSLLRGLKELGYAVNEGMSTTWSQNRRLVVRHPTISGCALELGGVSQNNQFQARVVAVEGEKRDSKTDQQVETEWCNELSNLRLRVGECGGEIKIDRALPAGAQALKVVGLEQSHDDDNTELRSRTLD